MTRYGGIDYDGQHGPGTPGAGITGQATGTGTGATGSADADATAGSESGSDTGAGDADGPGRVGGGMSAVRPAVVRQPGTPVVRQVRPGVLDLRGQPVDGPLVLRWPPGHRVVVSGLPGSGKSTLIRRAAAADGTVIRIDSQDARDRWARRLPTWLPYAVYRPVVRMAHYLRLRQALRSPKSVVVHDCGRASWVRRWLGRDTRRRARGLHLVLLDVAPQTALAGQLRRGRMVSGYAFERHRRAVARLTADVAAGRLPRGCVSAVLLDGATAGAVSGFLFTEGAGGVPLGTPVS